MNRILKISLKDVDICFTQHMFTYALNVELNVPCMTQLCKHG